LPLLERVRVEVYLPDPSIAVYDNLLRSLEAEFTYAFGGCTILRGLEGCYLSRFGNRIHDRINLIYSDVPLALSIEFAVIAGYVTDVRLVRSLSQGREQRPARKDAARTLLHDGPE
jgi:hypothetical protein